MGTVHRVHAIEHPKTPDRPRAALASPATARMGEPRPCSTCAYNPTCNDHVVVAYARALLEKGSPGLTDADDPHGVVTSLAGHLAPGSAVAISHLTGEGTEPDRGLAAQQVYQGASAPPSPDHDRTSPGSSTTLS
jgi:hypothetical protein